MINGVSNSNYGYVSPVNSLSEPAEETKTGSVTAPEGCQACKNRKYQDGSDENVSFKSAAHIDPKVAGSAVRAHEGEHISNASAKAAQDNGKVLRASVSIHTSICPECGSTYVSGGTTQTQIKYENEDNAYVKNLKTRQADALTGQNFDFTLE